MVDVNPFEIGMGFCLFLGLFFGVPFLVVGLINLYFGLEMALYFVVCLVVLVLVMPERVWGLIRKRSGTA